METSKSSAGRPAGDLEVGSQAPTNRPPDLEASVDDREESPAITWIQRHPSSPFPYYFLRELSPPDLPRLIQLYQQEPALTNRRAVTQALVQLGGDRVARLFTNALGSEFAGRTMESEEWRLLEFKILALGLMADEAEVATAFLARARDPDFWSEFRKWQLYAPLESIAIEMLVNRGWSALGMIGWRDFEADWLTAGGVGKLAPPGTASGILEGAFYASLRKRVGKHRLLKFWVGGVMMDEFQDWAATPEGRRWKEWVRASESAAGGR